MKERTRASELEKEHRIQQLVEGMVLGLRSRASLLAHAKEVFDVDLTDTSLDMYIRAAKDRLAASADPEDIKIQREKMLAQIDHLIALNLDKGDTKEVRACLVLRSNIAGTTLSRNRKEEPQPVISKSTNGDSDKHKARMEGILGRDPKRKAV